VASPLLAFRPARTAERLGARSQAALLAPREIVSAGATAPLPVVVAPVAPVARGALLAARVEGSALGLVLPLGAAVEPWFEAVARAADELAAGVPVALLAEVRVESAAALEVERAVRAAWQRADAGVTHLSLDATAVDPADRPRVIAELAAPALAHGIGVDVVVAPAARLAPLAAMIDALRARGVSPDAVTVRCAAAAGDAARAQAGALGALSTALGDVPVWRRGPSGADVAAALAGGPVRLCDDGGAAAASALAVLPQHERAGEPLDRALASLAPDEVDRVESRAFGQASDLVARLAAGGSARAVAAALARRLEER
jgi:hypothetical protein